MCEAIVAGVQKLDLIVIGSLLAITAGVAVMFTGAPGGLTMTAEQAKLAAHKGPRLIVVEASGCGWCSKLRQDLAPDYQQSSYQELAPLVYLNIDAYTLRQMKLSAPVMFTPTLLMVDREGKELGRIVGYPGSIDRMFRFVGRLAGRQAGGRA